MITSHSKINLTVDVEPLKKVLNEKSHLFGRYTYRSQGNSPHREMTDIWVRYNAIAPFLATNDFSHFADEHDSVWYEVVKDLPQVLSPVFQIMSAVRGERLGGVLITKLPPGGEIKPHHDDGWHAAYYDKYYLPIQNTVGSSFYFEDGVIHPREGEVYWFDNSITHWVVNDTTQERIAMIVCIKTNQPKGRV